MTVQQSVHYESYEKGRADGRIEGALKMLRVIQNWGLDAEAAAGKVLADTRPVILPDDLSEYEVRTPPATGGEC